MFGSAVLELAIAMAFVFLLVSLLVSAATEIIASWFRWRASNLWLGLRNMLGSGVQEQLYLHPLIKTLVTPSTGSPWGTQWLFKLRGVRQLWPTPKGPSYIPPRAFALALLDLMERPYQVLDDLHAAIEAALVDPAAMSRVTAALKEFAPKGGTDSVFAGLLKAGEEVTAAGDPERRRVTLIALRSAALALKGQASLFDPALQQALRPMLRAAGDDVTRMRVEIETWFNDGMDRVSGWYKRKTQAVQIAAGLVLALALDIDAALIARVFWTDPTLRSAIVAEADAFSRNPTPGLATPTATEAVAGAPVLTLSSARIRGGQPLDIAIQAPSAGRGTAVIKSSGASLLQEPAPPTTPAAGAGAPRAWTKQVELDASGQARTRVGTVAVDTDTIESVEVTVDGKTVSARVLVTSEPEAQFDRVRQRIVTLGLPVRGACPAQPAAGRAASPAPWWCDELTRSTTTYMVPLVGAVGVQTNPLRWLGWIITALATSFGAPFWFDLLGKFVNVRSAVRTTEATTKPPPGPSR